MSAKDLLLEIGAEEIPARFVTWAIAETGKNAAEALGALHLSYGALKATATPRRLVLYVERLSGRQDDSEETVKGPPKSQALDASGGYTAAALGFAKSRGAQTGDLRFDTVKGVEYLFAVVKKHGAETSELLPDFLNGIVKKLVFPKNMYWSDTTARFARPVRWLVALYGDDVIPISFGGVNSGRESRGHRFMGARAVTIPNPAEYWNVLEKEFVIADHERRKATILDGAAKIERETGCAADRDPDLLEEITQLVEYPVPFLGSFEREYLEIPEEVLIATMKKNQRYMPMRTPDGRLAANFIGVSNNKASDMSVVRDGNERVLRARLNDAAFFWKEDLARPLETLLPKLERVLYQESLGSVLDKSKRVTELAAKLVADMGWDGIAADVKRAAGLAKADLVTSMVFEFPEVQGVMGREYAKRGGEREAVADAIFEQYLPRFAGDALPKGKEGAVIGICDRVDTIAAIIKIGLVPTGSQDPYGLRRASRSINEIIWSLGLDIDLGSLFKSAASLLGSPEDALSKAIEFYKNRLYNQLRERGYSHGTTSLAVASIWRRPLRTIGMIEAFEAASGSEWFASLVQSAIRVNNILNKLTIADAKAAKLDAASLTEDAEKKLLRVTDEQSARVSDAVSRFDWEGVCRAMADLSPAISGFFENVMVMADDINQRNNRLALLFKCRGIFDAIGDFSLLKQ
ncbi:glycine--tRNA ligase beta subunit [Synergistales bacterium]|nr:glycine--tRNA ligase beta subunit [Synergistales bacterium]